MTDSVSNYTPAVLRWARERSGYDLDEIARKIGITYAERILSWETEGHEERPTYPQLERLAYDVYKRPLAIFFFPEPPEDEKAIRRNFRKIPDDEWKGLPPKTVYALRKAKAMQISVMELSDGVNDIPRKIFKDIHPTEELDIEDLVRQTREYLEENSEARNPQKGIDGALKAWRDQVENCGIFVFKDSLDDAISGFCYTDAEFPIIYINNSHPKQRQIFTLFHELAHIIFDSGHIDYFDTDYYLRRKEYKGRDIEVACNRFAAEFLVPTEDFMERASPGIPSDSVLSNLAGIYNVSREVILRRYLEAEWIDSEFYKQTVKRFKDTWIEKKKTQEESDKDSGGGNYYSTRATYLSNRFMDLAFRSYRQGKIDDYQISEYLGVKAENIGTLEERFHRNVVAK